MSRLPQQFWFRNEDGLEKEGGSATNTSKKKGRGKCRWPAPPPGTGVCARSRLPGKARCVRHSCPGCSNGKPSAVADCGCCLGTAVAVVSGAAPKPTPRTGRVRVTWLQTVDVLAAPNYSTGVFWCLTATETVTLTGVRFGTWSATAPFRCVLYRHGGSGEPGRGALTSPDAWIKLGEFVADEVAEETPHVLKLTPVRESPCSSSLSSRRRLSDVPYSRPLPLARTPRTPTALTRASFRTPRCISVATARAFAIVCHTSWRSIDMQHLLVPAGNKVWLYLAAPSGGLLTTSADPGGCADAALALSPHFITKGMFHEVDAIYRHLPAGGHQYVLGELAGAKACAPPPRPAARIVELDADCPVCSRTDRTSSCPACMPAPDVSATASRSPLAVQGGVLNRGFLLGSNATGSTPAAKNMVDGKAAAAAPDNRATPTAAPLETKGPVSRRHQLQDAEPDDPTIDSDGEAYPPPPELPRNLPSLDEPPEPMWTVGCAAALAVLALALVHSGVLAVYWPLPSSAG